jgi:membrane-associated HD superfamily phosphohydrolase
MAGKKKALFFRRGRTQKKGEFDSLPLSSKTSSRGLRIKPEYRKWMILIGLSIITSLLLFPNILVRPHQYALGDVADHDIKATRDFLVENEALTEEKRQEAVRKVLSVYDFDPTGNRLATRLREAFSQGRKYLSESAPMTGEDSSK